MGEKKHSINLVFTLALLGIFTLSALLVAVLGTQVYERTTKQMSDNFDVRTSLVYITEKIRQTPEKNVDIRKIDGSPALVLHHKENDRAYETWIFGVDGKLHEVTVLQGKNVKAIDGQAIMDLNSLDLVLRGDLLKITVFDKTGDESSVIMSLRY